MKIDFAALKFNVHGYINAIVQDAGTDEVLALVKMDGEALARTAENGSLWLYDPETKKAYNAAEDGVAFSVTEITAGKNGTVLLVKTLPGRSGLGVFTQPVWKAAACPCLNRTAFTAYLPKFTA